jgi:hypothetical protein
MGNWFHAPINQMFHRDALADGFDYGPFVWGADFYFCMNAASKVPTLYWPHNFGEFHAVSRAHYLSATATAQSLFEVSCVREIAAARLQAMTGDGADRLALSAKIEADALRQLVVRWADRHDAGRAMMKAWRVIKKLRRLPKRPVGGDQ